MKIYPPFDTIGKNRDKGWLGTRLCQKLVWLSSQMREFGVEDFRVPSNRLPGNLFKDCVGFVDTVPVYLESPGGVDWSYATYSGKYKANVLKFEVICDNSGLPVWFNGPHFVSRSH